MAHPAFALALPVRAWRVDLVPDHPRWTCSAAGCPGAERGRRQTAQVALGHLGQHAAAEPLPAYLRTCRCHAHGCAWHPRHRGCQGLVALTVFRSRGGATWQLADACSACARAIPHAAQLPQRPEPESPRNRVPARRDTPVPRGAASLQPLLTYLDAALLPGTPARVRLVALLCLLRADRNGTVRLPQGLLRAWRLADGADSLVADLVRQRWLHAQPADGRSLAVSGLCVADGTGVAVLRTTPRRVRLQFLDHANRLQDRVPEDRLAALRESVPPPGACAPAHRRDPTQHEAS